MWLMLFLFVFDINPKIQLVGMLVVACGWYRLWSFKEQGSTRRWYECGGCSGINEMGDNGIYSSILLTWMCCYLCRKWQSNSNKRVKNILICINKKIKLLIHAITQSIHRTARTAPTNVNAVCCHQPLLLALGSHGLSNRNTDIEQMLDPQGLNLGAPSFGGC